MITYGEGWIRDLEGGDEYKYVAYDRFGRRPDRIGSVKIISVGETRVKALVDDKLGNYLLRSGKKLGADDWLPRPVSAESLDQARAEIERDALAYYLKHFEWREMPIEFLKAVYAMVEGAMREREGGS